MGAAVLVVVLLCAQVETATPTETSTVMESETSTLGDSLDALLKDIGEDPLTSEELELLALLGTETPTVARTASIAWPAPGLLRPAFPTSQARRRETIARSTRESLDALPLPIVSFRGARSRVLYEGLLLAPFAEDVLDADVRMFDRVAVSTLGSRRDHASGAAGTIALYGRSPEAGIHPEASVEARSADRSTGTFAAVEGGIDLARGRAAIGYDDTRALRTSDGSDPRNAGQRWLASARIELFGREDDLFSLELGGDLDRAHNTRITDDGEVVGVATLDQRALAFARAGVGSKRWGVSLTGGYQGLRQTHVFDLVFFDVKADLFQARLDAFGLPFEWLRFDGGAYVAFGEGAAPAEAHRREIEGFAFASLLFDPFRADLGVRIAHQLHEDASRELSGLRVLPQVVLHSTIAGPFGFRAALEMGMTVPGGGLLGPASTFREPETTLTLEAGPTLRGSSYWGELTVFSSWIEHPLEATFDPLPGERAPPSLRVLGFELDGAVAIAGGFGVAFTASFSEAIDRDTGDAAYSLPLLSGLIALRHQFDFQNARVEVHVRAASEPFELLGDPPMANWEIAGERPKAFVRAGITGGLELGAGFALDLAVENAFDRRYRLQTSDRRGGGIDVRAALSWRY